MQINKLLKTNNYYKNFVLGTDRSQASQNAQLTGNQSKMMLECLLSCFGLHIDYSV